MQNPVNVFDYEALANQKLPRWVFDYFQGGANDGVTMYHNRADFDALTLHPHVLRDVSQRDFTTTILGLDHQLPLLIAPLGFMGLAHPESDIAVAQGAEAAGVGLTLSTMSSVTLEEVAQATHTPLWFQLIIYKNRDITRRLVQRAEAAGFQAFVLTVDSPVFGRREQDIRNEWRLPPHVILANLMETGMQDITAASEDSGLAAYIASQVDASITWKDVEWLRSITKLPVIVKGVLRADDAQRAVDHGAAGIIVSNHGGRQVDTSPSTITVLPRIVEAVDARIDVLLDGGIRRGTDIIKALALGAKGVLVGRPVVWGLSVAGAQGVEDVLNILKVEFDNAMALCGCRSVADVAPDLLG